MTLSIMTHTQHQHKDTKHNDTQHNDAQHNHIHHINTEHNATLDKSINYGKAKFFSPGTKP